MKLSATKKQMLGKITKIIGKYKSGKKIDNAAMDALLEIESLIEIWDVKNDSWKTYEKGIEWISNNDEPEEMSVEIMARMISVTLLADMFGMDPERVSKDIVKKRKNDNLRQE